MRKNVLMSLTDAVVDSRHVAVTGNDADAAPLPRVRTGSSGLRVIDTIHVSFHALD